MASAHRRTISDLFADPVWRRRAGALAGIVVAGSIAWGALVDGLDLTALSIAVAVIFGLVTSVQNAQLQVRQHTVELLASFSTADPLACADAHVVRLMRDHGTIDDDIDPDDDRQLIVLLDYYEFLSRAALQGQLDARTLVDLRGPTMRTLYSCCLPYLRARRERFGPGLYAAWEAFLREHHLVDEAI